MVNAANPIVEAASNILKVSSNVRVTECLCKPNVNNTTALLLLTVLSQLNKMFCRLQKKISNVLLDGMDNVQSALLNGKGIDQGPAIVSMEKISLFVNR